MRAYIEIDFSGCLSSRGSTKTALVTPWSTLGSGLALRLPKRYTSHAKSKSFPVAALPTRSLLAPLMKGKSVVLTMEVPRKKGPLRKPREAPKIHVVIVHWSAIGSPPYTFLVSVLGRGSTLVNLASRASVAGLVLAGIPFRSANALMDEFHRIYLERNHAPCESSPRTSTHRRPGNP